MVLRRLIAFEPDPNNFALMRINQILHGVDGSCHNYCMAMSDTDGSADLELSGVNFGDHRISLSTKATEGGAHAQALYGETERAKEKLRSVRSTTGPQSSGIDLQQVGLAWIDTQGHEGQILKGAGSSVGRRSADRRRVLAVRVVQERRLRAIAVSVGEIRGSGQRIARSYRREKSRPSYAGRA